MHKDLQLICAHLLGGTNGLNLKEIRDQNQIRELVSIALEVALEIERQSAKIIDAQTEIL
jgi:hypothetical protein